MSEFKDGDLIDFGDVPADVNDILQQGVFLYRHDRAAADARFRAALERNPSALAAYFCLYKIRAYQCRLDDALEVARAGLAEASRQAGLPDDWTTWTAEQLAAAAPAPARFALYTLKAMAFIHLKRDEPEHGRRCLDRLSSLGALDAVGGGVVADMARSVA